MMTPSRKKLLDRVEPLEARIAPASLIDVQPAVNGTSILLDADPNTAAPAGITTTQGGSYLIYVTKGSARVFTQDLNNNGQVDFDEITGISAGDGLRMISFVNIHGDIVTNLNPDGTLTDSDGNANNGRDGQILLNSRIEKIELRSVTTAEVATNESINDRIAFSNYSIFGNIYAGGGFGATDGGLIVDSSGYTTQQAVFSNESRIVVSQVAPEIGSIRIGTAASFQTFSFGYSAGDDLRGKLGQFTPPRNAAGGDIINVKGALGSTQAFSIGGLFAGDGGYNGRGGDIINANLQSDGSGGYFLIAGKGGDGPNGGRGGNIVNWTDSGTIGGQVFVKTGDGGTGILGRGGDGGSLTLDASTTGVGVNVAARTIIKLGNGGNGLTGGGNGGSQPVGSFVTTEGTVPFGTDVVTSWHRPGAIGNLDNANGQVLGFDFDLDGFNDIVYATTQQGTGSQLVVLYGTGDGGWTGDFAHVYNPASSDNPIVPGGKVKVRVGGNVIDGRLPSYLNSPANAAVSIGDFNGDGHPDIVAAGGDDSLAGVRVYLSQYQQDTNGQEVFVGFSDAIFSPIPAFAPGVNGGGNAAIVIGIPTSAYQVKEIVTGDFDNDGVVDLGLQVVIASTTADPITGTMWLRGDSDLGPNGTAASPTGYFYSDYNRNIVGSVPFIGSGNIILKATAMKKVNPGADYFIGVNPDDNALHAYSVNAAGVFVSGDINLGKVDTNREVSTTNTTDKISLTEVTALDVAITDLNGDGNTDLFALSSGPAGYLVSLKGNGNGPAGFTIASGTEGDADGGENAGNRLGGTSGPNNFGLDLNDATLYGIMAINFGAGSSVQFAVMDYQDDTGGAKGAHATFISVDPTTFKTSNNPPKNPPAPRTLADREGSVGRSDGIGTATQDGTVREFDVFTPDPANPDAQTISWLLPTKGQDDVDLIETLAIGGYAGYVAQMEQNTWYFTAGNGGDSINGSGGNGGRVGKDLTLDRATGQLLGSFKIVLPAYVGFESDVSIGGGNGGNGFKGGGVGGGVSGVSVTYQPGTGTLSSAVSLFAGSGGDGVRGNGGAGGGLSSMNIETGSVFSAGRGGDGRVGGKGGAVVGNPEGIDASVGFASIAFAPPKGDFENARDSVVIVVAGDGGSGLVAGGDGGGISGFTPRFLPLVNGTGGFLYYRAGDGGDSVGGKGGRGGSVFDSSPSPTSNFLAGDIQVRAGNGGDGKFGGNGGSIGNFVNQPTAGISPTSFTILAGDGGKGVSGAGGNGGSISQVLVSASGAGGQYFIDSRNLIASAAAFVPYSRVVAGAGGESIGGTGGNGGSIDQLTATASITSVAAVAGRGGDGLYRGGRGGSVTSSDINGGPQTNNDAQVLIIAGEGGDAYSGIPTASNPLVPGGKIPTGGDGGSILNVSQSVGGEVNVQLIAGNGGSLVNYGSPLDSKVKVGKGGSIQQVAVLGRIGNTGDGADVNVPIKAYNSLYDGNPNNDRMGDFVKNQIVSTPDVRATFLLPNLSSAVGNVGIVVGAKGRIMDRNADGLLDAASDAKGSVPNGSLIDVRAQHILSAVAGSVERIASIQTISNVRVTITGGDYGADRAILANPGVAVGSPTPTTSGDGVPFTRGATPGSLDYLTPDGKHSSVPVIGGRLVDGAIVAKTSRTLLSDRDFKIG